MHMLITYFYRSMFITCTTCVDCLSTMQQHINFQHIFPIIAITIIFKVHFNIFIRYITEYFERKFYLSTFVLAAVMAVVEEVEINLFPRQIG